VQRVYESTPAAEAGLQSGDILLEINGAAAGELGLERVKELFKLDEQEYDLSFQRGGLPRQVNLVTRQLV
jgi:S1-C subfamily serine protease